MIQAQVQIGMLWLGQKRKAGDTITAEEIEAAVEAGKTTRSSLDSLARGGYLLLSGDGIAGTATEDRLAKLEAGQRQIMEMLEAALAGSQNAGSSGGAALAGSNPRRARSA